MDRATDAFAPLNNGKYLFVNMRPTRVRVRIVFQTATQGILVYEWG